MKKIRYEQEKKERSQWKNVHNGKGYTAVEVKQEMDRILFKRIRYVL